jgi:hypothetical protein
MGYRSIWRTEPEGVLAAESDRLRLVVQARCRGDGMVRFLVLRGDGEHRCIVGPGTDESVRAAMDAAVRMAGRLLARPFAAVPDRTPGTRFRVRGPTRRA